MTSHQSKDSPHVEFHTPPQGLNRDKPSPLRIVKRGKSTKMTTTTTTKWSHHQHEGPFSKVPLKIAKRRGRVDKAEAGYEGNARPTTATATEMSRGARIWGDTLMRCRGLLTKSTPSFREAWKHGAQRGTSSSCSGGAWSDSDSGDEEDSSPSSFHTRRRMMMMMSRPVAMVPTTTTTTPSPSSSMGACPPSVLCPCIAVTSEAVGEGRSSSIWAAVEVSGRLSSIPSSRSSSNHSTNRASFIAHPLDRFFEYGCLYDLTVDIEPTPGWTIVQIIQEQAFPTTIYAGSSLLLIVHVQRKTQSQGRRLRHQQQQHQHTRQNSDDLMEDLELQLGTSVFMNVRVRYSHSAFPEHHNKAEGVLGMRSRMETMAGASLGRPCQQAAMGLRNDHLLSLVQRHWGADKTVSIKSLMQQREQSAVPSMTDDDGGGGDNDGSPASFPSRLMDESVSPWRPNPYSGGDTGSSPSSSVTTESKHTAFWNWGTWF
ncbi:hypothetical protein CP532_2773 [Ophiocordyceps camponoti-leonardi (nom. inval.)]|nr:hypothetical protein CP532_2773 [Ophiocordyceps camponoti-leonardi (nom. inval.)]